MSLTTLPKKLVQAAERLENEVAQRTITAWSLANNDIVASAFYADEMKPTSNGQRQYCTPYLPYFDLASLTKLLLTNTLVRMACAQNSQLLFAPLSTLITPQNAAGELLAAAFSNEHKSLRLIDFLNHTTGAKAWFWFGRSQWAFLKDRADFAKAQLMGASVGEKHEQAVRTLMSRSLECLGKSELGTYSDVNFFLLSRILENLNIRPFVGWRATIDSHNQQFGTNFFHASLDASKTKSAIPYYPYLATERVETQVEDAKWLANFGPVHDTNANILASFDEPIVSGHAGLFGTANDVVPVLEWLARSQTELCDTYRDFDHRNSRFVFGCDTPSSIDSTAGLNFWPIAESDTVGGFLGYTGTMGWFHHFRETNEVKTNVLLTNRTAQRLRFESHKVPRILVVVDRLSNESQYFSCNGLGKPWETISEEHAKETILFHCQTTTKLWDQSVVRTPPVMLDLRRTIGRLNWNMRDDN